MQSERAYPPALVVVKNPRCSARSSEHCPSPPRWTSLGESAPQIKNPNARRSKSMWSPKHTNVIMIQCFMWLFWTLFLASLSPLSTAEMRGVHFFLGVLAICVAFASALDNGAAPLPIMGYSTWNSQRFNVSAAGLMEVRAVSVSSLFFSSQNSMVVVLSLRHLHEGSFHAFSIKQIASLMVSTGLRDAGYNYVLLDDGWPGCLAFDPDGKCSVPQPRDSRGRIVPDAKKFPHGTCGKLTVRPR